MSITEPPGHGFWYDQGMASRSSEERAQIAQRVQQLRGRQNELNALVDDLEARGATEEEWEAYNQAFAQWNNDVMDLAEETNTPLSLAAGTAISSIASPGAHEAFVTLMVTLDEPLDGNHRMGKGGLLNR